MKNTLIVAVATVLVLANGASVAFADTGSESGSTTPSTTIANESENTQLSDAQIAAYKAGREVYRANLEVIKTTFKTALGDAEKAFTTALVSATTDEARAAAQAAFRTAGITALQNYQDSLIALGLPPVKPELSQAQKDARKAEIATSKGRRTVIMETFRAAMKSARDTFKSARELATTDIAKKTAKSTFKTAVRNATQMKTDALRTLGTQP